ncbi:DNA-protecting protein DprA [Paenibacillus sp. JMULE4]|uniref:DNA-processing protein DprA n=1 Tax=Paenibacillus sp. JMULE4 TaxID=2518342 RepID=UPI0015757361|nr:DNA-processing protein DprA [Paenibacillus sp. JMULE4]NTZ18224.1 DNA-protecting protein DprA [Paenibacillus sp. JMULE4]
MNNRLVLFALHQMQGIGWKTVAGLVRQFPELSDIMMLKYVDWLELGLTPVRSEQVIKGMRELESGQMDRKLKLYEDRQIGWTCLWDADYPGLLRETAAPPWILYYRGHLELAHRPCIAMVGTRNPTAYGKVTAQRLSASLSSAGLCVVSGLARGIDSAAHEGALREAGGTIGVLGCSMEQVYPPENKLLYRRISEDGLLLSEYPLGTKPRPGLFPQRNRIIAGLSLGVVVVEAALNSGSLITADLALEASRDVFAVPGPITSPKSQGTLHWLKLGAKLVTGPEDILEEYRVRISFDQKTNIKPMVDTGSVLPADEQRIYDLLSLKPMNIEELLAQSQYKFGHLHSVLINLLMMQRIVELPGSVYTVP